ncbi:MAG: hypothetical protein ABIR32_15780 [Ilumatobacteraceae bacterium]
MRRTTRALIAVAMTVSFVGLVGLVGCSSDGQTSSTGTADAGSPDGSFCSLLIAFRATNQSFDAEFNSGVPDRAKAVMTELNSQSDLLRRKAPSDIKADVSAVAAYLTSLDSLLAGANYDVDAVVADEQAKAAFVALTTDEVNSSLLQLRTYADTTCAPPNSTPATPDAATSTSLAG